MEEEKQIQFAIFEMSQVDLWLGLSRHRGLNSQYNSILAVGLTSSWLYVSLSKDYYLFKLK